MPRQLRAACFLLCLATLFGCGAGGTVVPSAKPRKLLPIDEVCLEGEGPIVTVRGAIDYERLVLNELGVGPGIETRPVRLADVQIRVAGGGACYGRGSTDAEGRFALAVRPPEGSELQVWVLSRTLYHPARRVTVHHGLPPLSNTHGTLDVFAYTSPALSSVGAITVDMVVPYPRDSGDRPAIGFGVLDTLLACDHVVRTRTGVEPPPCHAYTRLGNNGITGTSFYDHAARSMSLLGGAAGNLDGSDTDYFDEAVIAHEYGHLIELNLSHSLSRGGPHSGEALEPSFAWSEGQATGLGCLCLGDSRYVDSVTTSGGTLLAQDVENWFQTVRGMGSEETVAEVLWDLGDGAEGRLDQDLDGVAVGLGALYGALFSFRPDDDAPYLGLFLDRLVERGSVSPTEVGDLLRFPKDHGITYPLSSEDRWPTPLPLGTSAEGEVDAAVLNPCRALASSRWYAVDVAMQQSVSVAVEILPADGSSPAVEVRALETTGDVLARAEADGPSSLVLRVPAFGPGRLLVRVAASCSGQGGKAAFRVTVEED